MEENEKSNKELFIEEFEIEDADCGAVTHMVVFIRLASGDLEMSINTSNIHNKFSYYKQSYDDNLRSYANPNIKIVNWCFASQ